MSKQNIMGRYTPSIRKQTLIILGLAGLTCSGCTSSGLSYQLRPDDVPKAPKERVLGSLHFNMSEDEEETNKVHLYKVRKGYALKANLDQDEDRKGDFVVMRNKDYRWFAGFQWRFEF